MDQKWILLRVFSDGTVQVSDCGNLWHRLCDTGLNEYSPFDQLFRKTAREHGAVAVAEASLIVLSDDANSAIARLRFVSEAIYNAYTKIAAEKEKLNGNFRASL